MMPLGFQPLGSKGPESSFLPAVAPLCGLLGKTSSFRALEPLHCKHTSRAVKIKKQPPPGELKTCSLTWSLIQLKQSKLWAFCTAETVGPVKMGIHMVV